MFCLDVTVLRELKWVLYNSFDFFLFSRFRVGIKLQKLFSRNPSWDCRTPSLLMSTLTLMLSSTRTTVTWKWPVIIVTWNSSWSRVMPEKWTGNRRLLSLPLLTNYMREKIKGWKSSLRYTCHFRPTLLYLFSFQSNTPA